jgi:tetratricopeptide (TPR) repeat protein
VAALLEEALQEWRGPAVADVPLLAGHAKVHALAAERRAAVARYGDAMIATGGAPTALPLLAEDAAAEPLDEAAQARLVRAYHAAGHRALAFATADAARRQLATELGVDPGAELTAAYQALLHTTGGPARPAQLPAGVAGFTGRAAELGELDRLLPAPDLADTAVGIVAICGTPGVGKTALAVRWARRALASFPDGQLYLDLRGYDIEQPMSTGDALARLLDALGVDGRNIGVDLDERAGRYRTEIADRRMLVVLDNAASLEQIQLLLPGTPSCRVLVTSRDSLGGLVALHGAHRIALAPLPGPEATRLLRIMIGDRVDADPERAAILAEQCARLPLALRIAAELAVTRPATPLSELVNELADRQRRLSLLKAGRDSRAAMRVVFSWSYQHLPADAARLFRWLGLHPGADLDVYAAAALAGTDLPTARHLLDALARAHLIEVTAQRNGQHRFGAHDLLRAYATDLCQAHDGPADRSAVTKRLLDYYLGVATRAMLALHPAARDRRPAPGAADLSRPVAGAPGLPLPAVEDSDAARAWLDAERQTLVAICGHAAASGWPGHAVALARTVHRYLEGGHYADALAMHSAALAAARQAVDEHGQADAHTVLGIIHRLLGRYATAGDHLREALALHRRTADRHGKARTLSNLGIVEERLGRHDAAADHHRAALRLYRSVGDRYGEAGALTNLGNVFSNPGQHERAARHFERALQLFRELADPVGAASALSNLGDACTRLGRHGQAAAHLSQALAIFRDTGHRYGEATVLSNLGQMHSSRGDHDQAIAYLEQALALFRDIGHRYGEASALNGLGEALYAAGRHRSALARHGDALAIAAETGDDDEQARAHAAIARARTAATDAGSPVQ